MARTGNKNGPATPLVDRPEIPIFPILEPRRSKLDRADFAISLSLDKSSKDKSSVEILPNKPPRIKKWVTAEYAKYAEEDHPRRGFADLAPEGSKTQRNLFGDELAKRSANEGGKAGSKERASMEYKITASSVLAQAAKNAAGRGLFADIIRNRQRQVESRLGFAEAMDKARKESSQMQTSDYFWDSALGMDDGEEEEEEFEGI